MMSVFYCGFDLVVAALNLVTQCCLVIDCVVSYCFLTHCGLWYILYTKPTMLSYLAFSAVRLCCGEFLLRSELGVFLCA